MSVLRSDFAIENRLPNLTLVRKSVAFDLCAIWRFPRHFLRLSSALVVDECAGCSQRIPVPTAEIPLALAVRFHSLVVSFTPVLMSCATRRLNREDVSARLVNMFFFIEVS